MREFYSFYKKISEIEKRNTIKSNKELNLKSTYKFTRGNQTLAIIIESKQIIQMAAWGFNFDFAYESKKSILFVNNIR